MNEYDFGSVVVPNPGTKPISANLVIFQFDFEFSIEILSISNPELFVSVAVVQFSLTLSSESRSIK